MTSDMFNNKEDISYSYDAHFVEQYKLFVDSSQRISERRERANVFFMTVNAALLGTIPTLLNGFKPSVYLWLLFIPVMGVMFCWLWYSMLKNYKQLNSAKFKIIHIMEERMPVNLFRYEWDILGAGKDKKVYTPLSKIEQYVSHIFLFFHISTMVFLIITITQLKDPDSGNKKEVKKEAKKEVPTR